MLTTEQAAERIIVALDCGKEEALRLAGKLQGHARWVKIGMTLFYAEGPAIVAAMKELGYNVFLDLKLHDIPHQVKGAAASASVTGADIISIHGLGGPAMVAAAREGADSVGREEPARLIAITILTSMNQESLEAVGIDLPLQNEVARLAELAYANGAAGIVCSPQEAAQMRELLGPDALIVTPGVRLATDAVGDQARVATPGAALASGASMVVIGRPITGAADVVMAFNAMAQNIQETCA